MIRKLTFEIKVFMIYFLELRAEVTWDKQRLSFAFDPSFFFFLQELKGRESKSKQEKRCFVFEPV